MNQIDLSKNQLVEGDVKVRYWYDNEQLVKEGYLALVNHKCVKAPYRIWDDGKKAINNCFNVFYTTPCKHVELIEPKYRVKDFFSLIEILKNEGFKPCFRDGIPCISSGSSCWSVLFLLEIGGKIIENTPYCFLPMSCLEEIDRNE